MLAGNMKLTHFLGIAAVGGVALAGGLGLWLSSRPERPPQPVLAAVTQQTQDALSPQPLLTSPDAATSAASAHIGDTLAYAGSPLGADKKKDVSAGKAYKINVYQDDGQATANRAKVDLDRDDKWDEKWTFHDDGTVTRAISPADDEQYSQELTWDGQRWSDQPDAGTETAAADAPAAVELVSALETLSADTSPHMGDVLRWVGQDLGTSKKKDVSTGKSWKVNVYQDDGQATANRAKVDLDRDDKWDEKWTFHDGGKLTRQVAPADDESYTQSWVWNGGGWALED